MIHSQEALAGLKRRIHHAGVGAVLFNNGHDITYLTGLYSESALLLVRDRGKPVFFINKMNRALTEKTLKLSRIDIVTVERSAMASIAEYLKSNGIRKMGYNEETLSVAFYAKMVRCASGVKIVPGAKGVLFSSIMRDIRMIKTDEEIGILRRAAKETMAIWRQVRKNIGFGMTEKEVAQAVDVCIREKGYENSFPTIAASGVNTAYPHAVPSSRRLKEGEHLVLDFGIRRKGYCSDLTRIWRKGRISRQIKEFHESVQRAHDFAIKALKPGAVIGRVAERAYNIFHKNKLGDFVLHGLGHGVGLEVHEAPFLRVRSAERLREGMVITIEPGLYKARLGGVRVEDMVLITPSGCEVLTV